jgi:hypothetical protein
MTGPSLRPLIASSLALALLGAAPDRVDAGPGEAGPLRVHLECEAYGRTKACPEFFTGFIDEHDALLTSPRAVADVVLYVHESAIASTDRLHLRFTSKLAGAPPVVEFDVDVDSRTDDDTQLATLRPAFLRGIALYVAVRRPELVETTLAAPTDATASSEATSTTPWGVSLSFGGNGSWTSRYQNYSGWSSLELSRLTAQTRSVAWGSTSRYLSRQPPLVAPDGSTLSLDSSQWSAVGGLKHVALLSPRWSIGAATSVWTNDDKGQYRYGVDADVGLEWDKFDADDPRGNSLAIAYVMGYQVEAYNLRNELGERSAHYPTHRPVGQRQLPARQDHVRPRPVARRRGAQGQAAPLGVGRPVGELDHRQPRRSVARSVDHQARGAGPAPGRDRQRRLRADQPVVVRRAGLGLGLVQRARVLGAHQRRPQRPPGQHVSAAPRLVRHSRSRGGAGCRATRKHRRAAAAATWRAPRWPRCCWCRPPPTPGPHDRRKPSSCPRSTPSPAASCRRRRHPSLRRWSPGASRRPARAPSRSGSTWCASRSGAPRRAPRSCAG